MSDGVWIPDDKSNRVLLKTTDTELGEIIHVRIGPTDPISDLPVIVDFDHHQNHEGEAYQWYYYNAALNGTVNFRLTTPAGNATIDMPHIHFGFICDKTASMFLFEAPTVNAAGDAVTTIRCRNRSAYDPARTPGLAIRTGATFTADGIELHHALTIASAFASINSDSTMSEWILKPATEYMVRIVTGGASIVMLRLNWYEDLGV